MKVLPQVIKIKLVVKEILIKEKLQFDFIYF